MAEIFGEFFLVSVSHETKHENSSKNSGKIRRNSGQNPGQKFEKLGELSFCDFSDLKINAIFFFAKFFDNPSGHGRLRRKSWTSAPESAFSCGPGGGEKLFDPWAFGRKGQECQECLREIRTKKFMFMLFFSSLICALSFLSLLFWKRARKPPKKQGFLSPPNP